MEIDGITLSKEDTDLYLKYKQEYEYYDRLQYVFKILLNSTYGALGNIFFKFYDLRNAESTTRSGREILFHMVAKISELIDGEYLKPTIVVDKKGRVEFVPKSPSIIAGDTDSTHFLTHSDSLEMAKKVCGAIEKKVNESFPDFVEHAFNSKYNKIKAGLDFISSRGLYLNVKKYYALHLDHLDGHDVDKLKIMGLQIKKTTIPKVVGKKLTEFVEQLLRGEEWKTTANEIILYRDYIIEEADISEIGLPKGIKDVDRYTEMYNNKVEGVTITGHHMASIHYNNCLEKYNDIESPKIISGSKIRIYYLDEPMGDFKSIALPTDLKSPPKWFEEHFIPRIDRKEQASKLIDSAMKGILDAIDLIVPTRKSMLYDEMVEY